MPSAAPADLEIRPLAPVDAADLERFDCGDADLDEFLRVDAIRLGDEHVVQTYLARRVSTGRRVVGYVALLSDAVRLETKERKKLRLASSDHPIVPALKIARLAVASDFQRRGGIGVALVRFAYVTAAELAEIAGCRLLTLDAYPKSIGFYEKLGFVRNRSKEYRDRSHPSMRLDVFAPDSPTWL